MLRRTFITILIAMLVLTSLSACKSSKINEEDLGRISSVEVGKAEKATPLFEEQECPFNGYALTGLRFDSAMMSLKVPSSWSVKVENPSLIRLDASMDDPYFPGNTFYIQCIYDYSMTEDELNQAANDVSKLHAPFKTYLEGLKYSIAGSKEGSLRRWRGGWDSLETPDFVEEDNLSCTGILSDEILYDKKTSGIVAQNVGLVATFFAWQDFPVMISTFALRGEMEDAKKMTEYMMSTVSYRKPKIGDTEEKTFGKKVSASLPSEFKVSSDVSNVYRAPTETSTSTSGISLGIYEVTDKFADKSIDAQELMRQYGQTYAFELMDPACTGLYEPSINVTGEAEESLVGEVRAFFANCTMITNEEAPVAAYKTYGPASLLYMNCYVVEKNEKHYLVISLFPRHQSELSYAIERLVIKSLKA